ncbi:MAG: S1 RNA-binding domain-containing protein [Polyangia bacterium]
MRKPPLRNYRQNLGYPETQHRFPSVDRGEVAEAAIVAGEESFAELFEASLRSPRKAVAKRDPEMGALVQGEIVQIGAEFAFLDIGGKAEAMISLDELRGEDGQLSARVGDKIEGHVVSVAGKEGGLVISGRLQRGAGLSDQLRQAHEQGTPVQGLVTGANKGGLDVDLGGVRAFLPSSQIELRYCQDPSIYLGRALTLRVTRLNEESRSVVVSRRAVLEVEQRGLYEQNRARLAVGARFNGTVVSTQEPTALVDLGGLDGALPMHELQTAARNAGRSEDSIKVGQRVEVEVLRLDEVPEGSDHLHHSFQGNLRITLALKGLLADPLDEALQTLGERQRLTGRVVRLEPFGAFVELAPGVEGLVHISAMAERHITHPREILSLGQELQVTVVSLDRERRRIGLSLIEEIRAAQAAVAATLTLGSRMRVRVERVESNGVIVRVLVPNVLETTFPRGLIPNNELNVPRGSDLKKLFPTGRELVAAVQSVDGEGRVRLSLRAVTEPEVAPAPAVEVAPAAKPVEPAAPAASAEPEVAPAAKPTRARATRSKKTPVPAEATTAESAASAPVSAEPAEAPAPAKKPAARRKAPAGEAAGTEAEPAAKKKPSARTPAKATATPAPLSPEAAAVADRPAAAAAPVAAATPAARKKPAAEAAPEAAEPAKAGRRVRKSA